MTIIVGSAVAVLQVQLYMTEFILVTLPDWEKEESVTLWRSFWRLAQVANFSYIND
jgi:hypothetical protein